jgi:hypothetical protein
VKLIASIIAGYIALCLGGLMPMAGIFAGAAMQDAPMMGSVIMYGGFIVALAIATTHIWGQIKYWKTPKGEKTRPAFMLMYAGLPMAALFMGAVALTFET